jgi:protein-S-isoprenylcysteine O-methyltransferase Ste14
VRATDFEFRHRFWIAGLIYGIGFQLYSVDHQPLAWSRGVLYAGALVAAAGAALRTWAEAYLHGEVVHDQALHSDRLVADGPYRYVRNPLYLGAFILAVGMATMASRLGAVVVVAGTTLWVARLIGREEAALAASLGERYAVYTRAVPRFLPALRPRLPASGATPRFGQAFIGESFMWGFSAAIAAFAVTLNLRWFFGFLALSFALAFATRAALRAASRPGSSSRS